ncbi:MAG: peptidase S10 [Acidobacteria bacterium]|nr:MAG: peptidase S10 [Acidobacteriota bacterium]
MANKPFNLKTSCWAIFLFMAMFATSASVQFAQQPATPATAEKVPPRTKPRSFVTQHRGVFNGVTVDYTANVAETILPDPSGKPAASLVSIAYTQNDEKEASSRAVTFIFNGGPGSSSVWLHMAAFSPRRADLPADGQLTGSPPYPIVDNHFTLLDVTDLVFIDPIGTGFSRLLPNGKPEDFYGVIEDGRSMCDFLSAWLTANKRWNSPKFVAGESYGTIRAAEMAKQLPAYGIFLNGVILFGQAMDFTQTTPIPGFDMSYTLYLPSMAATAWYWNKVNRSGRTLEGFVEEARKFAQTDYAVALFAGSRLDPAQRKRIAARLSELTGLSQQVILDNDIRVTGNQFCAELLKSDGKVLSRYDSRYVVPAPKGPNEQPLSDPIGANIGANLTTVLNQYLRTELGVDIDEKYEAVARLRWNNNEPPPGMRIGVYENVAPYLGSAMRQNSDMRVFIGNGYYDMLTPLFSAEHTVAHAGMPLDRVKFGYYHAGHMPYLGESNLKQLSSDLRAFITARN